ncbi:MocR-like pyridoxine biosynthesis transcription factor PdxR [Saccharomonospora xinjiangensis]|uniref:Transcriptional regulator with HTH domain and aminotransferase domain n=1 Tax=Saccharomonospora xinjiangensis XJ-54 TaxID=882086 RepID=I0V5X2_9PSEU|nr:PLP-dependent aminotransferase family protein [Saccharomonospora xinjiangensis]EID55525.1 transcriptional regulator with HTH domain and aminotransferase domain [Saccharomonospora xinjiangensis XJ-54]
MPESRSTPVDDLHLDWDPASGRAGLAEALRHAIRSGRLPRGTALPSTRSLAADLGIARGSVTRVYTDLADEGYVRTRQGAPTVVTAEAGQDVPLQPHQPPQTERPLWTLVSGLPDLSAFPRSPWLSATRKVLNRAPASAFDLPDVLGVPALREALAHHLRRSRGVVADPGRIVVCAGYAHGLSLLSAVLRARGLTRLAFENPSLWVHRDIATASGLTVTGVDVDGDGVRVADLTEPAVVVTPAHQYPTGVTLAPHRRTELARAARQGLLVIEDDYDGEFRFDRAPVGAVQALAPECVVYAGSVSKTLAPGLRLGWLVLPRFLVPLLRSVLEATRGVVGVLDQLVFAELLNSGAYARHVRRSRATYRRRRDRIVAALPEGFAPRGISAGLHVLIPLPDGGPKEADVISAARRHSLQLATLGPHWITSGERKYDGVVVGYAAPASHAFQPAIAALVCALTDASAHTSDKIRP